MAIKAREGQLPLEDMKGASVTITNIGSVGGTYATPIINHPEVAILGVYKMTDKPLFKEGQFHPVKVMNFTITCDHRLMMEPLRLDSSLHLLNALKIRATSCSI